MLLNGSKALDDGIKPLNVLVPAAGTPEGRLAIEIAVVLAAASKGTVTALHVIDPRAAEMVTRRAGRAGTSVLVEARRLGKLSDVAVRGITRVNARPEIEIGRFARAARYDLLVIGTSLRQAEKKFLGPRTISLLRSVRMPILLITR